MAEPRIKWRDKDTQQLAKTVKNFNAKIARLIKKNPSLAGVLPQKVSFAQLKKSIDNRKDYNNLINSLKRFTKRGAEALVTNKKGLTVTKWEKREVQIKANIVNRRRKKQLEKLNPTPLKGTMKTEKEMNLSPKKVNFQNRTKESWDAFKKAVHKQAGARYQQQKEIQYFNNYNKAIDSSMGEYGDILRHLVNKAGAHNIYEWYADDQALQLEFYYTNEERANKIVDIINAFGRKGITITEEEANQFKGYDLVRGKIDFENGTTARYSEVDNSWWDDVE